MRNRWFLSTFGRSRKSSSRRAADRRPARKRLLRCEWLEDRRLLSNVNWINPAGGNWDVGSNWSTGMVPTADDDAKITIAGPATVTIQGNDAESVRTVTTAAGDTLAVTGGSLTVGVSSTLSGSLNLSGGTVSVASGAVLTLAGATNTWSGVTVAGTFAGSGSGTVSLASGTLIVGTGGATFNFPASMFQWSGGNINLNGKTLTNTGTMALSNPGGTSVELVGGGTLANQGTINVTGTGGLTIDSALDNQAGAVFNFQADATIRSDYGDTLSNEGTITMTAATGTAALGDGTNSTDGGLNLVNNGVINVASGTLTIAAADDTSTSGTFTVAQNALVNLTGGHWLDCQGTFTGSGQGTVQVGTGRLYLAGATTFNFPAGLFQWNNGDIDLNGYALTNTGTMALSNPSGTTVVLAGGGTLANQGAINVTGTGGLQLQYGAILDNQAAGTLASQANATITNYDGGALSNEGTVHVASGTLAISTATVTNSGGAFTASQGAVLDMTGGQGVTYQGTFTGSGQGTVQVGSGTLIVGAGGATFDFSGSLFQWNNGTINLNGQTLTNTGTMVLSNPTGIQPALRGSGTLANQGTIDVTGTGGLDVDSKLDNQAGAVLNFQADATIRSDYGDTLSNEGTITMTAAAGTAALGNGANSTDGGLNLVNNGVINVASGKLTIAPGMDTSTSGTFLVAQNALIDLTGGAWLNCQGTFTGSGQGTVQVGSGTLFLAGATTFNFPAGLFQWNNGNFNLEGYTLTNTGTMALSNPSGTTVVLAGGGTLANQGAINVTGTGDLQLQYGAILDNQAGAF